MKTDKLAEEILYDLPYQTDDNNEKWYSDEFVLKAMQKYHKAKLESVTDEDIEKWAEKRFPSLIYDHGVMLAAIIAAKAFKNGLIKHT